MMPMLNNRNKITGESYDQALLWVTLILLAFGLVMVYSASISWAEGKSLTHHQATYYLVRHAGFLVAGLLAGKINLARASGEQSAQSADIYAGFISIYSAHQDLSGLNKLSSG